MPEIFYLFSIYFRFVLTLSRFSSRLRTLEFWVDNLNPEFLFPELSKQKNTFVSLMKALSIHLRPAPYPYGLLTLRLLGKLGGKNRRVLREPIAIAEPDMIAENAMESMSMEFTWSAETATEGEGDADEVAGSTFRIDLPIQRCLDLLKTSAAGGKLLSKEVDSKPRDVTALLSKDIGEIDLFGYCTDVTNETILCQVKAAIQVLRSALTKIISVSEGERVGGNRRVGGGTFDMQTISSSLAKYDSEFKCVATGLMFGCSFTPIRDEQLQFMKGLMTSIYLVVSNNEADIVRVDANGSSLSTAPSDGDVALTEFGATGLGSLKPFGYFEMDGPLKYTTDPLIINEALSEFLSHPSPVLIEVGLDLLKHVLELPKMFKEEDKLGRGSMIYFESLLSALCDRCVASDWNMRNGLYKAINMMVGSLGQSWAKRYEIEIMNVALYAMKSVPSEMSIAAVKSFGFLVQLCGNLYGKAKIDENAKVPLIVDMLSLLKRSEDKPAEISPEVSKPCDDVLQMLLNELASTNHIVRYVFRKGFWNIVTASPLTISVFSI